MAVGLQVAVADQPSRHPRGEFEGSVRHVRWLAGEIRVGQRPPAEGADARGQHAGRGDGSVGERQRLVGSQLVEGPDDPRAAGLGRGGEGRRRLDGPGQHVAGRDGLGHPHAAQRRVPQVLDVERGADGHPLVGRELVGRIVWVEGLDGVAVEVGASGQRREQRVHKERHLAAAGGVGGMADHADHLAGFVRAMPGGGPRHHTVAHDGRGARAVLDVD